LRPTEAASFAAKMEASPMRFYPSSQADMLSVVVFEPGGSQIVAGTRLDKGQVADLRAALDEFLTGV
jgi:hypothetical protein